MYVGPKRTVFWYVFKAVKMRNIIWGITPCGSKYMFTAEWYCGDKARRKGNSGACRKPGIKQKLIQTSVRNIRKKEPLEGPRYIWEYTIGKNHE
jgi:hypothetical protein